MKDQVINALKNVFDPEMPINIWDLGLIYDINIKNNTVKIQMTMTSPTCPESESIMENTRTEVAKINGINNVEIELVWTPAWSISRMSEQARIELDLTEMGW